MQKEEDEKQTAGNKEEEPENGIEIDGVFYSFEDKDKVKEKEPKESKELFKGIGKGRRHLFNNKDSCVGYIETVIEIFDKDGKLKSTEIEVEPVRVNKIHAMRMGLIPMDVIEDVPS